LLDPPQLSKLPLLIALLGTSTVPSSRNAMDMLCLQTGVGACSSMTVTLTEQVLSLPQPSDTVYVTSVVPCG